MMSVNIWVTCLTSNCSVSSNVFPRRKLMVTLILRIVSTKNVAKPIDSWVQSSSDLIWRVVLRWRMFEISDQRLRGSLAVLCILLLYKLLPDVTMLLLLTSGKRRTRWRHTWIANVSRAHVVLESCLSLWLLISVMCSTSGKHDAVRRTVVCWQRQMSESCSLKQRSETDIPIRDTLLTSFYST